MWWRLLLQDSWSRLEGKDVWFVQILEKKICKKPQWSWMLMWISEGCLCQKVKIPLCLQWAVMAWLTQLAVSVLCYLLWESEQIGCYCSCAWVFRAYSRRLGGRFLSLWGKQGRRQIEQDIHAYNMCCGNITHPVRCKWPPILSRMVMRP